MSLDNIQLPALAVQGLFRKTLVELKSRQAAVKTTENSTLNVLGKNQKHIVIVVANEHIAYLEDDELNFLLGILAACKLNMDDVCILNLCKNERTGYTDIAATLHAEKVFLFGCNTSQIQLPLSFPDYQVQRYNNQVYLTAPALTALKDNKTEKTKLWNCLKQIFSI